MTTDTKSNVNETGEGNKNSSPRYLPAVARILMGLAFLVFGLNGFLNFIPQPKTPMPEGAGAFAGALMHTGYMFQLISGTQVVVAVLLLINRFVPLALVLLAPILVNIIAFHIFLAPSPSAFAPGIVLSILEIYLAWSYRHTYRHMLTARTTPT